MVQYSGIFFLLSMPVTHWYSKSKSAVFSSLETREHGLTRAEAARRIATYGPNKLPDTKVDGLPVIFLRQFQSPLIYILLVATLIVFIMEETADGIIILVVLLLNAVVGTFQEGKAQNTFAALKKFIETTATVLRDGEEFIIPDADVVPGDVIILQEGEKIPADARIISSTNLEIDEAALTGESTPVHKIDTALRSSDLQTSEQRNMVFKGTHVVRGTGKAVVVTTGIHTIIGTISKEIASIDSETPLKAHIRSLSRAIIIAVAVINVVLFILGILQGKTVLEMFTTLVSLSVSIVPEGLPVVMTLVLATGVWRMSKQNALVKKLQAVEALGQADIIAVDKTGTLTRNEMVVEHAYVNGHMYDIGGNGYEPSGIITRHSKTIALNKAPELALLGTTAAFCAGARVLYSNKEQQWHVAGDPTEAALLVFSKKVGVEKEALETNEPLIDELPFDHTTKYHAVIRNNKKKASIHVVGAPEAMLALCDTEWHNGKTRPLTDARRQELEKILVSMSKEGLRVIAAATRQLPNTTFTTKFIKHLTFTGFFGIKDALRLEVFDAMAKAKAAGLRVVMITGDYELTAKAIAKEAGIYSPGDAILTGSDLTTLPEKELAERVKRASVFARVSPQQKLSIIEAYKRNGMIIAMTGDGVNDAPSLVAADLGVSMGKIGTEVAKEASDIVLLDDNFGSIVAAIEEGRSIYNTIKKIILYLFSTNIGEVLTISAALVLSLPLPILPVQILWLNFVTDGFLVIALALEPKEKNLLQEGVHHESKHLIDKLMAARIIVMAIPMMIGTVYMFEKYLILDNTKAWTVSLTTLAVFQWFNVWNCRSKEKSIFQMNPFSNPLLIGATIIVILLQVLALYHPFMQSILRTSPIDAREWIPILLVGSSVIAVEEIRKFFYRRTKRSLLLT